MTGRFVRKKIDFDSLSFLAGLVFALTMITSCGYRTFGINGPFRAVVLSFTGTDDQGKAQFTLGEKTFRTMTNFNELDGTYANVRRGGTLTIRNINGSIVSSENFEGGTAPNLRYNVKSGVASALDYSTLAMLSAYYQLDEIYSTVEDKIGIPPSALQAMLPNGKHSVLFEPEIKISNSGSEISAGVKLNAAFSPPDKKFLLFQRSPIENIPLAANLQVISHEFGHFVFDYAFFLGKFESGNRWSNEWAISGINEGFADFISWSFTGSSDILRSSIDISDYADERDFAKTSFRFSDLNAEEPSACGGGFYCFGTLFARSLYQTWSELKATVTKKDMALGVIQTLQKCQNYMEKVDLSVLPLKVDRDNLSWSAAYEYDGKILGGFIHAFIVNAPAAWKPELCIAFINNFGDRGFPAAARTRTCN
jgi:hypothetical protein